MTEAGPPLSARSADDPHSPLRADRSAAPPQRPAYRAAGIASFFNGAVWRRAAREALGLLVGCAVFMFAFHWLYVYLSSLLSTPAFISLFEDLPKSMRGALGMPLSEAAKPLGRIALGYVEPTVVFVSAVWALARGSDAVSGPLDRGTLELVLAQPVRRGCILAANAGVTIGGGAVIALCAWLGTCAGIATVHIEEKMWFATVTVPLSSVVAYRQFVPAAVNLFALTVFSAGMTTLISACDRYRWRTLGIAGGFYIVEVMLKVVGRLGVGRFPWVFYLTFLGAYWPESIVVETKRTWAMSLQYNGLLLGGAAVCYAIAAIVFARRDLPAPL